MQFTIPLLALSLGALQLVSATPVDAAKAPKNCENGFEKEVNGQFWYFYCNQMFDNSTAPPGPINSFAKSKSYTSCAASCYKASQAQFQTMYWYPEPSTKGNNCFCFAQSNRLSQSAAEGQYVGYLQQSN